MVKKVRAIPVVIMRVIYKISALANSGQRSPFILRPQVVGKDVSDEKGGSLVHE